MKNYIYLTTFNYTHESFIVKALLEQESIRFQLKYDSLFSLLPLASTPYGGIRLLVHPKDFKKAKKILDSFQDNSHLKIV